MKKYLYIITLLFILVWCWKSEENESDAIMNISEQSDGTYWNVTLAQELDEAQVNGDEGTELVGSGFTQ